MTATEPRFAEGQRVRLLRGSRTRYEIVGPAQDMPSDREPAYVLRAPNGKIRTAFDSGLVLLEPRAEDRP